MSTKEPVRFVSSDVPELAETLKAARGRLPDDAAVARMAAALGLPSPAPSHAMPSAKALPAPSVAPVAASVSAVKLGVVVFALLAAGGAFVALHGRTVVVPRAPSTELARNSAALPVREPEIAARAAAPVAAATPAPPAASAVPVVRGVAPPRRATELELIQSAEHTVHSDPARALSAAEEHARLYPNGELAEERDVLVIEALVGLGRNGAARSRFDAFRKRHPNSPYDGRIERSIGSHGATHSTAATTDAGTSQKN